MKKEAERMGYPSLSNYTKPRPVWMIVLGDSLLYCSQTGAAISIFENAKWFALSFLFIGTLGYFLTRLYKAKQEEEERQIQA